MKKFEWLKKYMFDTYFFENEPSRYKHMFMPISNEELEKQEKRMGRRFPLELRDFYKQIGYGSLCFYDKDYLDEIMSPESVVDFILQEGCYENDSYRKELDVKKYMPFFDIGDDTFFSLDLSQVDDNGCCPVVYSPEYKPIILSDSLEKFIIEMDKTLDFYEKFFD